MKSARADDRGHPGVLLRLYGGSAAGGRADSPPRDVDRGAEDPDSLTLYAIDGIEDVDARYAQAVAAGEEVFHQYAVLGKVEIADAAERAKIVSRASAGRRLARLRSARASPFGRGTPWSPARTGKRSKSRSASNAVSTTATAKISRAAASFPAAPSRF